MEGCWASSWMLGGGEVKKEGKGGGEFALVMTLRQ